MILTNDQQVYTGITTDINRRWREHTSGKMGARYFRGRKPEYLCYLETNHDRSSASQREAAIKALKTSDKWQLIAANLPATHALLHQQKSDNITCLSTDQLFKNE